MRIWVITLALMSVPLTLTAQSTATITTNAAIHATSSPAPNVSPMRVAALGTVLVVVAEQGDWLQIEFADPQKGRRTGWIRREHARLSNPDLVPMDLSIRAAPVSSEAAKSWSTHSRFRVRAPFSFFSSPSTRTASTE